jgi:phospholipid transport system substrate-binding protein
MRDYLSRRAFAAVAVAAVSAVFLPNSLSAQAVDPAAKVIQGYYASLFPSVRAAQGLGVAERARRIAPAVLGTFDIGTMTRLAVGPDWSRFSGAQTSQVRDAFSKFLIADYASQLGDYSGQDYSVNPEVEMRSGDRIVKTKIGSTTINYLVRGSRIVDIYANGTVSELATRRAEFSSILASSGPEALIQNLRQRTQQLLGG